MIRRTVCIDPADLDVIEVGGTVLVPSADGGIPHVVYLAGAARPLSSALQVPCPLNPDELCALRAFGEVQRNAHSRIVVNPAGVPAVAR